MKWVDNIRIRAGKRILRKEVAASRSRKAKVCNIADANAIALLFKITKEEDYINVQKFSKYLKSEFGTKKVFVLGYWDDPKKDPEFMQSKLDFDYFSKKDLNWFGIPSGGKIENFLQSSFDILIDLNNYYNVPLRYLIAKCNANLKVGRFSKDNEDFFDVMIGDNKMGFEAYGNELVKYLGMLNP